MSLDIKHCQQTLLNLLKLTDEICRKHNISYWVDGGTLLGAIRNNKFIPWDDDVDICLLPDDYKKLLEVLKKEVLPKKKHLMLYSDYRSFPHYSEYLADTRIVRNNFFPVQIDIIQVKSLPNTEEAIKKDKSIVSFVHFFKYFKFKDISEVTKEDLDRYLLKSRRFLKRDFHTQKLLDYCEELNEKNNNNVYSYIYNDMYVHKKRGYYDHDTIFPLSNIKFEGMEVMCPNNVKSYLSLLYGENFMEPPPSNQQKPAYKKYNKNIMPLFLTKSLMYTMYYLKNIKNAFLVNKAIKKLKK